MTTVTSLVAAHRHGDAESLKSLAITLAAVLKDPAPLPPDPVGLEDQVDTQGAQQAGTWQEIRAARDTGALTDPEYQYLAAAVDALTMEDKA